MADVVSIGEDRTINLAEPIVVPQYSAGVDVIRVVMCDPPDWQGLSLYVSFSAPWLDDAVAVEWDGSSDIVIPTQCTRKTGFVEFGIGGNGDQGQRAYTVRKQKTIEVVRGGFAEGELPADTPTITDTLRGQAVRVEAAVSSASTATTDAETATARANSAAAAAEDAAASATAAVETAAAEQVPAAVAEAVSSYVGALSALSVVDGALCMTYEEE